MSLQPNETANELLFALRLTEVGRWGIVAMSRQQSVGEHSFRVCMIAQAMYSYVEDGAPHNSFEKIQIGAFAMVHDMMEILSGDLDSIFKMAMEAVYPGAIDKVVTSMGARRLDVSAGLQDTISSMERATRGTIVEAIVKLSDMVEALLYLDMYGTNQRHKQQVRDNILERMWQKLEKYKKTQSYGLTPDKWARVEQFINLVLDSPGLQEKALREA